MPEQTQTPAAESSPAAIVIPKPDTAEYATWRQTGELPGESTPKEASTPSPKSSEKAAQASEKAADSEPAKKQEHRSNAETRLTEILDDLRNAGLSPAELKTFKREAKAAAQETPKAVPEQTEKPVDPQAPRKPKFEDYSTYEEYEAAKDKYYEDLSEYRTMVAVERFRAEQRQEKSNVEAKAKLAEASARYGETAAPTIVEAAKSIFTETMPAGVKAIINDSPVVVDLLYVLNSKPGELAGFIELARTNPGQAIRKAVLMEQLVSEELGKSPATTRDTNGKFVSSAPETKVSKAPPPPREVSGRGSPPPDEVEQALKHNDFRAFREAANRRDLMKWQGKQ